MECLEDAAFVIPKLKSLKLGRKLLKFREGLNILVIDNLDDKSKVISDLCQGQLHILMRYLSGGGIFMLLIGGIANLHLPLDKCIVVYGVFEQLDKRNKRTALKLLSRNKNQIILVTNQSHFEGSPKVKANIIRLKSRPLSWYRKQNAKQS